MSSPNFSNHLQERRNVDQLRQDVACASGSSSADSVARRKKQTELDAAVRRLTKMQEQLGALREAEENNKVSRNEIHLLTKPSISPCHYQIAIQ